LFYCVFLLLDNGLTLQFTRHKHGGQLQLASQQYGIPVSDWLDLSTGISPFIYPLSAVPSECWQRLPEPHDGLEAAAEGYYGSAFLLPVSGSQEAIQRLPYLWSKGRRVGMMHPAYHSHQQAWEGAGHRVVHFESSEIDRQLPDLDVLVLVNPTNPSTELFTARRVMAWQQKLAVRGGTLIIDEAFMDATPEQSVIRNMPIPGLIVLRSIGKFFGMAGVRLGFVWAEVNILEQLASRQDDWSVSHPSRWAGTTVLRNRPWQKRQRIRLSQASERLCGLLSQYVHSHISRTALFAYFQHEKAKDYHQLLAQHGILTRLFETPLALRFGLPASEAQWLRLEESLKAIL